MIINKIRTDYHMHTTFSPDGHDTMDAMCQAALIRGMQEIAITEHAEWIFDMGGFPQVVPYFEALKRCQAKYKPMGLTVYSGIELGNPHQYLQEVSELLSSYRFDFVIGSLHWLHGNNIHLKNCFANRDPIQVYADYFIELGRLSAESNVDLIAHFDRILWRGALLGASFDPWYLEPIIRDTLKTIAQRGQSLELNTKFLTHTPNWNETLVTMLRWYREAGGLSVVVNSDAHRVEEIGRDFSIGAALVNAAGFSAPAKIYPHHQYVMAAA